MYIDLVSNCKLCLSLVRFISDFVFVVISVTSPGLYMLIFT